MLKQTEKMELIEKQVLNQILDSESEEWFNLKTMFYALLWNINDNNNTSKHNSRHTRRNCLRFPPHEAS